MGITKFIGALAFTLALAACGDGEVKAPTLPTQVFNICEEKNTNVNTTFNNTNNCNKNNVEAVEEEGELVLE